MCRPQRPRDLQVARRCSPWQRSRVGYILGWLVQCAGLALGFLNTTMFFVGALFAAVWVMSFVMGKRLDSGMEASPEGGDIH